jgi:hypothetical protein
MACLAASHLVEELNASLCIDVERSRAMIISTEFD